MSEVINRIHELQKRIFDLEEELRHTRSKYADEIDHSDELADLVRQLSEVSNGAFFISSRDILEKHERRREQDHIDENNLAS